MGALKATIEESLPGIYVHSIQIGSTEDADRKASFLDNVNRQIDEVCAQLREDERLRGGFNAVGFSQGGLFMRTYVQRCNNPPVRTLITFGSPHGGVADVPGCQDASDASCALARSLLLRGAYWSWVQNRVVQAQYFRDPRKLEDYFEKNIFLPDVNNELEPKKLIYAANMKTLKKLVLIQFEDDETVVPKESAWFYTFSSDRELVPIQEQPLYKEDSLGLKTLDQHKKLVFASWPGRHMQIDLELFKEQIISGFLNETISDASSSSSLANPKHDSLVFQDSEGDFELVKSSR
ncbi:Palmitoyl-protein thioesterase 1 [Quaeritorhiza haematococci]|nr:Palmitoyl-protein thioesterase 1 [Quaeritorhiza haematococci]